MGLDPLSFGIMGLALALWTNGLALLGYGSEPAEGNTSAKSYAVLGSMAGAIGLGFFTLWHIIGAPGGGGPLEIMFASLGGKFALLWTGVTIVQLKGWDMRPVGTMCLLLAIIHAYESLLLPGLLADVGVAMNLTFILLEVVFVIYILVLLGFWLVTHGKIGVRPVGWVCILGTIGSLYVQFMVSGVVPIG